MRNKYFIISLNLGNYIYVISIMSTKKMKFDGEWKNWIWDNIKNRDCSKAIIFKILLENNFDYDTIKAELDYDLEDKSAPTCAGMHTIHTCADSKKYDFNNVKIPGAKRFDSDKLVLFEFDNFLSDEECDKLLENVKDNKWSKSFTVGPITGKLAIAGIDSDIAHRTSSTCYLNYVDNKYVDYIDNKISKILGVSRHKGKLVGEEMQFQYYKIGEQFKLHKDGFYNRLHNQVPEKGNRTWTCMVYLNNVIEGGATYMSEIDHRFIPKVGKAVIWCNLNNDGTINENTSHAGEPIIQGKKYIITKWFREIDGGLGITTDLQDKEDEESDKSIKIDLTSSISTIDNIEYIKCSKNEDLKISNLINDENNVSIKLILQQLGDAYLKYEHKLIEEGYTSIEELKEADLTDFINDIGMKKPHAKRLIKMIDK